MTTVFGSQAIGVCLAATALRMPDKVAIVEGDVEVTFRQLDAAATALAQRILAAGAGRPGLVCLLFDGKLLALKAIFGACRSGHAYVPLDARDPDERLRFIVRDSAPIAVLTETALIERTRLLAGAQCAIVDIGEVAAADPSRPLPKIGLDALVHVYYTSGSTGQPKGVCQTHGNVLFACAAYAKALRLGETDRLTLLYTLSFNAAQLNIFGGLLNGGTICPYDMRRDGIAQLPDWLDRERITVLHTVPTVFRELGSRMPAGRLLPHLRVVDLGGESVFDSDVDVFRRHTLPHCVLINQLAATETGLIAQYFVDHRRAVPPDAVVPAGRCPDGVRVVIRRDDGTAAAVNEVGEILVCGGHLSPGYWQRPDLDAVAFSVDPDIAGWRRYATNDIGRFDEHGELHFHGRKGSRIKLRGNSVDLAEVEAALAAVPGVAKAAVLARSDERRGEADRLVAYLAMHPDAIRDPRVLRRRIATRLPSYMLPASFIFVDALPLTATGKVDRKALAQVEPPPLADRAARDPPRGDLERTVAHLFEQLLKVSPVDRDDDFFLLGGDSLGLVELQTRLREACGTSPSHFHEEATVAGIADAIRRDRATPSPRRQHMPVLLALWRHGTEPPLFLVHGRHGQASVSSHFMHLLGDNQPVYAFQARGLDGLREPHATVEDMATEYLGEMRRQRPHGPYFLAALCAGAFIAAVMARSLRAASEVVLPLLLLDPPAHLLVSGYSKLSEDRFVRKMKARRALGRTAGPVDDPTYMQRVRHVALAFEGAIARHRPRPYDGPVYILSSRQRIDGVDGSDLRWIFTGHMQRFGVGGTHDEALDPRNPVFSSYLLRCVGMIREAARAGGLASVASPTDPDAERT